MGVNGRKKCFFRSPCPPPPLLTGTLYSPQFRSHQDTKMAARPINDQYLRSHRKMGDCEQSSKKDIVSLLLFLGLQSNQVAERLKSCVYKFYSCVNLKFIFQNTRCIKSLGHPTIVFSQMLLNAVLGYLENF